MKTCTKCKQTKELSYFRPHKSTKDNLTTYCKICLYEQIVLWKEKNKEKLNQIEAVYREQNREKLRAIAKRWRQNNKGKKNADTARRFAAKMQRTPKWLTDEEKRRIVCYYQVAQMRNECSDTEWHVDHIIPLRGETVCGLHVPWNLRVIPAFDNISKSNRFETD